MSDFIKDGSFEIANTINYILSIQVSLDGFSFFIVDPETKKIVAAKNFPLKISNENLLSRRLKEWLDSNEFFKNRYKLIRVLVYTESFGLVPEEFSGPERQRNVTAAIFEKKNNTEIAENSIKSLNASLYFQVPQYVTSVLTQFFKQNIEIIHPVSNLIQAQVETKAKNVAFILSTRAFFYLVVFVNNKLTVANCFQTPHVNDLVYSVINTFKQLEIVRSETDLRITGAINQNDEIAGLLNPYFIHIRQIKAEDLMPAQ